MWCYIWFFLACISLYLGWPFCFIFSLCFWDWAVEAREYNEEEKRKREEYERLYPEEVEKEKRRMEYLRKKWEWEKKQAALKEIERQKEEIREFEEYCLK